MYLQYTTIFSLPLPPITPTELLTNSIESVRTKLREENEPSTLRGMLGSIVRHYVTELKTKRFESTGKYCQHLMKLKHFMIEQLGKATQVSLINTLYARENQTPQNEMSNVLKRNGVHQMTI